MIKRIMIDLVIGAVVILAFALLNPSHADNLYILTAVGMLAIYVARGIAASIRKAWADRPMATYV